MCNQLVIKFIIIYFLALFSLSYANDFDINELQDLSFDELLQVEIQTGSFLELDLMNSPFSMTIIDKKKIWSSGARHLTELLEIYVPGFQYSYNKWNGEIWGMRGVSASRNTKFIFLVNGHKMNTQSRDGATTELNLGLLGDIERVEVLRGPAGLVYGSGAIAGIVNIVTQQYVGKDTKEATITVGTWDFSNSNKQVEAQIKSKIDKDQSISFQFGYRQSEGNPAERSRIWGKPQWPYTNWLGPIDESVPNSGCTWCTPGNIKTHFNWNYKKFELNARYTHQVSNAGGLFILDPWPELSGNNDTTLSSRWIDGKLYEAYVKNDAGELEQTRWAGIESWGNNRRQYIHDNISITGNYTLPLGKDEVKFMSAFDGNTNRINLEKREGFEALYPEERTSQTIETFGEKRYTLGAQYLLNSIDNLQFAGGYEFRYDAIGNDLTGKNGQNELLTHPTISHIQYTNNALYFEGIYEINSNFMAHLGARYDIHTRTKQHGGVFSPKIAGIYKPNKDHSLKLIYQSSANNGSADEYEYNRLSYNQEGVAFESWHYQSPENNPATSDDAPLPGATLEQLHQLKPEKVQSLELTSVHKIGSLTILPSVSINYISELFVWNQNLFRSVNGGNYQFITAELDINYSNSFISIGLNHGYQRPVDITLTELVGFDVDLDIDLDKKFTILAVDSFHADSGEAFINPVTKDTNWLPIYAGTTTDSINLIRDQITVDGKNFLNLVTHISKIYFDVNIVKALSFHSDMRIFWGFPGRRKIVEDNKITDGTLTWQWHDFHKDPIVKLNASLHWSIKDKFRISFYVYDILAEAKGKYASHSLRWHQSSAPDQIDLIGVDQRSFAVQVSSYF
ncbi:MAG: TonB-dependent receptor plug domain-containing protein [Fibrobacterales bacterium]